MFAQEKLDELYQTQTKESALFRLNQLRLGSLADNPSEEYLLSLLHGLYDFQEEIKEAIQKCYEKQESNLLKEEEWSENDEEEEAIKNAG